MQTSGELQHWTNAQLAEEVDRLEERLRELRHVQAQRLFGRMASDLRAKAETGDRENRRS